MKDKWANHLQTIQKNIWLNFLFRYGLSILVVIIAFGLHSLLTAQLGPELPPYIIFYPAVIIVALLLGFGPGLLSTLLLIIAGIWILSPAGQFAVETPISEIGAILFGVMGVLISITAELYRRNRKKAIAYDKERALRESEERFQTLADNIPNLAWMADADGKIFWYNKQWYDYTGTTFEEMEKQSWQKFLNPDYVESITEKWSVNVKKELLLNLFFH